MRDLDWSEADRMAPFGEVPEEPYQTATGEEWQLGGILAQRYETKIPFAVTWSRIKPFPICFGMHLLKNLQQLPPITVVRAEKQLRRSPYLFDQVAHAA